MTLHAKIQNTQREKQNCTSNDEKSSMILNDVISWEKVVKNDPLGLIFKYERSFCFDNREWWFYVKVRTFYHRDAKVKIPPSSKIVKIQIPLGIFKTIFFVTKSTTPSKIEVPFLCNEPLKLVVRFLSFTILSGIWSTKNFSNFRRWAPTFKVRRWKKRKKSYKFRGVFAKWRLQSSR